MLYFNEVREVSEEEKSAIRPFTDLAGIAIENGRLYAGEKESSRRLDRLHDLTLQVSSSLDLSEVLDAVAKATVELLGGLYSEIFLLENETDSLRCRAFHGTIPGSTGAPPILKRGVGLGGWVVQHGEAAIVSDVHNDPRWIEPEWAKAQDVHSYLCVPLPVSGEVRGFVGCFVQKPDYFTESDLRLLESLAGHAAVAMEKAGLYQTAQENYRDLVAVDESSQTITSSLDLDKVLSSILQGGKRLTGASFVEVWLRESERNQVLCRAGINPSGVSPAGDVISEDEKGLMRDVIGSGKRLYLREAVKDPKWVDLEMNRDDPIGSYLGIPMRFQGRVIGALTCITPTPRDFSEATLNAMSSLAAHAAIAIENSRLLTEAQGRATTLEVLDEISRAINATLDLDKLFQITAQQVKRVVPCDRASLFILDADKREISQISSVDDVKERQPRVPPATLKGTRFEEILRTLEPVYIPDTREDPHPRSRVLEAEGLRSVMNTPIVTQGECVGFLNVAAEAVDAFSEEHIQLLRWVADHLGAAIRNAELYARVRETGERLDRFVRGAADGIMTVDLDGRITSWNPGAKAIYGYSEEEMLGEHITWIYLEGERDFKAFWERLLAGGSIPPFEVVRRRKDGTPVNVSITASAIKDQRGRFVGVSGIHRDITERKQAELALERFRTILDQTGEAFYIIDGETGDFVDVNDTACRMLGYSRDELLVRGPKDIEVAHKIQTPEQWRAHLGHLRETGKTLIMEENVHRRKDGTSLPVEVSVSLQTFESRDYVVAVVRDITERKRSEEALNLTQFSIERAGDATYWIAPDGRFLFVNEAACNTLGYSREELLSMRVPDIDPGSPGHSFPDNWERVKRSGAMMFETLHLTKDGTAIPVEISANFLEFAGKEYIFSFVRDITERKQADEALQDLNRELGEKNKELETIVHVASHDLRSPLVTIQGYSEELAETCQDLRSTLNGMGVDEAVKKELLSTLDEKISHFVHCIQSGASRIDVLLKGLLRVSRLGQATVGVDRLDMNAMMTDIAESLNDRIHKTGADLRIESLPSCRGDVTLITQVFSNLVDNALKYRDPSRPPVIDISAREEEENSIYCVKDNGIGVRPDLSERIFDIFHRLKKSDIQGEGLGLTIARQIVARHNGKIWVESDPGEGSAFYIVLPRG